MKKEIKDAAIALGAHCQKYDYPPIDEMDLKPIEMMHKHKVPLNNESWIQQVEEYYTFRLPEPWRAVLMSLVYPPHKIPWKSTLGELTLEPMLSAEHQVETDDGVMLKSEGFVVIGYVEGEGDAIITPMKDDPEGDPKVYYHHHDGRYNEPLGSLSSFLKVLAKSMSDMPEFQSN